MNLLSRVSYWKIKYLATKIEIRSTLNVLGLCSNKKAATKNAKEFFEVVRLIKNLNPMEQEKLSDYCKKHPINKI